MSSPPRDYTIRVMSRAEVDLTVDWAAEEGWNPGLDDATSFHASDPLGFLMGFLGDAPTASISVVSYGAHFAFLGFYIARPQWRGHGYGLGLWRDAMARLGERLVGLDGVVAQQANYMKSGFRLAYRNIRMGGSAPDVASGPGPRPGVRLVPVSGLPFDRLLAYDRAFFPAPRPAFLSLWLTQPRGTALAAVEADELRGLGVIRPCREGFKLGPLYADDEATADALFRALARHAADARIYLDVPEPNPAALRLAERYALKPTFETARMYTGDAPAIALDRLYGVTTFELG